MRHSENSTLEKRVSFSRDWRVHYLHKSSGTMLKMDRALAVGNAHGNSTPDEIYLEAESITRLLSFFFPLPRAGGIGITDNPSKKRSKRFSYRVRGRCWN